MGVVDRGKTVEHCLLCILNNVRPKFRAESGEPGYLAC